MAQLNTRPRAALVLWVTVGLSAMVALTGWALSAWPRRPPPVVEGQPPFRARYAEFAFEMPRRADLYQARKYDFGVIVHICNRDHLEAPPASCQVLSAPAVNQYGVRTSIKPPSAHSRYSLLKEKPEAAGLPPIAAMVAVPEELVDARIGEPGEAYELSRLRQIWSKQIVTTARGWPMAVCQAHQVSGVQQCSMGFLIKGAFVEASFTAEEGVSLSQREIWLIASAIDAKLRGLAID